MQGDGDPFPDPPSGLRNKGEEVQSHVKQLRPHATVGEERIAAVEETRDDIPVGKGVRGLVRSPRGTADAKTTAAIAAKKQDRGRRKPRKRWCNAQSMPSIGQRRLGETQT